METPETMWSYTMPVGCSKAEGETEGREIAEKIGLVAYSISLLRPDDGCGHSIWLVEGTEKNPK
tara:strand:+ start:817 stop:1008 length:192 start_codon:yes stop_codon:yes gene_type:complete